MSDGIILGKLERRVSQKKGTTYTCIHVYAKNSKGELKDITGQQPIYIDSDKLELLTQLYNIPLVDMTK